MISDVNRRPLCPIGRLRGKNAISSDRRISAFHGVTREKQRRGLFLFLPPFLSLPTFLENLYIVKNHGLAHEVYIFTIISVDLSYSAKLRPLNLWLCFPVLCSL